MGSMISCLINSRVNVQVISYNCLEENDINVVMVPANCTDGCNPLMSVLTKLPRIFYMVNFRTGMPHKSVTN